MFTGRIREMGVVEAATREGVRITAPKMVGALTPGGAVCVDGVRLTVRTVDDYSFHAAVSEETRRRSTFDAMAAGTTVNIEPPLCLGDPLDGHLVQGAVDAVGKVVRVDDEGVGRRVWIRPPHRLFTHLVGKTPIAVDGVSVTVADVLRDRFSIVLLPATVSATGLGALSPGDRVNLEADLVTRLVAYRGGAAARDLYPIVTGLPWAGHVSGRAGVDKVLRQLAAGGGVMVWDADTEAEADVIFAGTRLKPAAYQFLLTQVCGFPAAPCAPEVLDRLGIEPIPGDGDRHGTAFCVPVDLAAGTGTGVSAAERAATVRRLADPNAVSEDFLRPGHVSPLRAKPGLLDERQGHTEATVALCVAAGLAPVGVCCELMNPDGTMAGPMDAEVAALRWGIPLVELTDLREWL